MSALAKILMTRSFKRYTSIKVIYKNVDISNSKMLAKSIYLEEIIVILRGETFPFLLRIMLLSTFLKKITLLLYIAFSLSAKIFFLNSTVISIAKY